MSGLDNDPESDGIESWPEMEAVHAARTPAQRPTDEQISEIARRARAIAEQLGAKIPERRPTSGREIVYQAHGETDPSLLDPRQPARRLGVGMEDILGPEEQDVSIEEMTRVGESILAQSGEPSSIGPDNSGPSLAELMEQHGIEWDPDSGQVTLEDTASETLKEKAERLGVDVEDLIDPEIAAKG